MAYKDRIYDITAWDMSKRLEWFLNKICGADGDGVIKKTGQENISAFSDCGFKELKIQTLGKKIKFFCEKELKGREYYKEISKMMEEINNNRIEIVHPKSLAPILDRDGSNGLESFRKLQETCFKLEGKIKIFGEKVRIKEVLPTLEYDMGNAGDIIKHGLLVEFIEWWGKAKPGQPMKVADTFAGCPWDNMSPKIRERLKQLKGTRLSVIQNKSPVTDTYMGSSLLMLKAASKNKIHIDVSDKDEDARCNWDNVTMEYKDRIDQSIKLICPRLDKDEDKNNGYNILDSKYAKKYDLILLDPYSEFLRDEFYWKGTPGRFDQILELVEDNPDLFIAVFVLDMKSTNPVGKNYANFKQNVLKKLTFSLRCPKIPREKTEVSGESKFDSEILLISKQIADKECGELRKRLTDFAEAATKALRLQDKGVKKVEFWPNE